MRCPAAAVRAAAVVLAVSALAALIPATAAAARSQEPSPVTYQAPVDAPIIGTFRPPSTPYGAGNRGVDYLTVPGTPVRASAPGVVAFAGQVGGTLHVVVLHADGIRTSYSFLQQVGVQRGQRVVAGQVVAVAGPTLHFGARAGDAYLDPLVLLGRGAPPTVYLVPAAERALGTEAEERSGLRRLLSALPRAGIRVAGTAVAWARQAPGTAVSIAGAGVDVTREWLQAVAPALGGPFVPVVLASAAWWERRGRCTPAGVAPPPPSERRLVVLVAGLGSTSENAAVYQVDTDRLGYAPEDVSRFSYRGGTTDDRRYGQADTQVDIGVAGRRLRALLEGLSAQNPDLPVDVVAHSQGGLVIRAALGERAPPAVRHVATLGSPHQGADLATVLARTRRTPEGLTLQVAAGRLRIGGIDPRSRSVRQLAETSTFLRRLNSRPLPPGVRFTSIAARTDVVVASPQTRLAGATQVVVPAGSLNAHSALPGSAAATRELALARAEMDPTCESLVDALADVMVGQTITTAEDLGGWGLVLAAR